MPDGGESIPLRDYLKHVYDELQGEIDRRQRHRGSRSRDARTGGWRRDLICRSCEIAGYLTEDGLSEGAEAWHDQCKGHGCGCDHGGTPAATPGWRRLVSLFVHVPHPHLARRKETGPVKVRDQLPLKHQNPLVRFNARLALACTAVVGSMYCAYAFGLLAFAGLPTALKPGNIGLLFWISSDFLQLTLLSVIIVGQNLQASAADKRAQQTYEDAEAVLHEALQIQQHLMAQDAVLERLIGQVPVPAATVPVPTAVQQKGSGT